MKKKRASTSKKERQYDSSSSDYLTVQYHSRNSTIKARIIHNQPGRKWRDKNVIFLYEEWANAVVVEE